MKKLAIVIPHLSRGGAERVTIYLAEYMNRQGISCEIITFSEWEYEYSVPQNIRRIILLNKNESKIKLIPRLRKTIKNNEIDTLLIMDVPTCVFAIPACFGLCLKVIISERNSPDNFSGKWFVKVLSRYLMKMADGFVFQTEEAKQFYVNKLKNEGVVIPNPLLCTDLPDLYEGEKDKSIVSVGRLDQQKNQILLIRAFSRIANQYNDYKLIIYGEGKMRPILEKEIKTLNMEKKIFLPGNVPDVLKKIKTATLFVLPSLYEGMPNALIEAMAMGLPCIATDCPSGGARELIKHKKNGILIRNDHSDELMDAILFVLAHKEDALRMGREAMFVRKKLDGEVIGRKWIDYLRQCSKKSKHNHVVQ